MKIFWALFLGFFLFAGPGAFAHHHKKTYQVKKYEKKHARGLKRHKMRHQKFLSAVEHVSYFGLDTPIPGSMDISSLVSLPEDQGQCGACWDFSLTKALRSEYMLASADPGVLEFNYLLNNCGPGPQEMGCNGGDFDAAQSFESGAGPNLNSADPFTQQDGGRCPGLPVLATATKSVMLGGSAGPVFKDLAAAVSGVGDGYKHMLSIDVAADNEWESYSSGIYNGCDDGANDINHMIDLVGYNCETSVDANGNCVFDANGNPKNGDGYLIVENNWNETWGIKAANGHGGYMFTRFMVDGQKCNAIATDALQFTIAVHPIPPTPPVPPAPPAPAPAKSGIPWWVWVIVGVGVLVLVAVFFIIEEEK